MDCWRRCRGSKVLKDFPHSVTFCDSARSGAFAGLSPNLCSSRSSRHWHWRDSTTAARHWLVSVHGNSKGCSRSWTRPLVSSTRQRVSMCLLSSVIYGGWNTCSELSCASPSLPTSAWAVRHRGIWPMTCSMSPISSRAGGFVLRRQLVPRTYHRTIGDRALSVAVTMFWNRLSLSTKSLPSLLAFRRALKTKLFHRSQGNWRRRPWHQ